MGESCHPCFGLVRNIQSFVKDGANLWWSHVLKETNQAADRMANHGMSCVENLRVYDHVPSFMYCAIMADLDIMYNEQLISRKRRKVTLH
ncbi:hypothetical protein JHK85_012805 [Glycine max]|nr:hypothetical protein JHK85_012805 [Glycine max]